MQIDRGLESKDLELERKRGADLDNKLTSFLLFLVQAVVVHACSNFTYSTSVEASSYGYFRDVNLMIFFGFGFLMTYLHRHGLTAIGFCLVISALVVEISICVEYLLNKGHEVETIDGKYPITIENLMSGLFCAGAVMISLGAVIGKVTPAQLTIMAIVEVFAFWANFRLAITENEAHDVGGGMVIHVFGAYFGLAATWWVTTASAKHSPESKSSYSSDIFSLAGTIILWVLWPSFQSAAAGPENRQFLAIANTFLSLCSSTLAFAVFTRFFNSNKFSVTHMQNATLAGGVVMGVAGDMDMGMHVAMLSGFASGLLSCLGYSYLGVFLDKLSIHDTCGVNNLHGMPGILGAVVGIVVTARLGNGKDDKGFQNADGEGIGADKQAFALLISIGMSLGTGTLAGFLMSVPLKPFGIFVPSTELFKDGLYFGTAADYDNEDVNMSCTSII